MTSNKHIRQSTFEDVVRENIDDFGLSREEAVKDAIKQFTTQGVNLSNICVCYTDEDVRQLAYAVAEIDELASLIDLRTKRDRLSASSPIHQDILTKIGSLQKMATHNSTNQLTNLRKSLAAKQAVNLLGKLWDSADREVQLAAMELTRAICSSRAEDTNRDQLSEANMNFLCQAAAARQHDVSFALAFLQTIQAICHKAEANKVKFVRSEGLIILLRLLQEKDRSRDLILEVCRAFRSVTAVDDMRTDFNSSYNHIRTLVQHGVLPLLISIIKPFQDDLELMKAGLAALKNLASSEDSVSKIANEGGLDLVTGALQRHLSDAVVARVALAVFRSMSADDKIKSSLCRGGGCELILQAMQKHAKDAKVQENALATIGSMALRSPDNASILASHAVLPTIVWAMKTHAESGSLQRQACLAVRNLVARNPELIEPFLDVEVETALRQAGRYQESIDEAYAALRDLRCEVKRLVVDPTTGKLQDAVDTFGQGSNSAFRQSWDTSQDLDQAVYNAMSKPADLGYRM